MSHRLESNGAAHGVAGNEQGHHVHQALRGAIAASIAWALSALGFPSVEATASPVAETPALSTPPGAVGPVARSATVTRPGYWVAHQDGGVTPVDAPVYGDLRGVALNRAIVGTAGTPDGRGYWLVAADGGIFSFGDAAFLGSTGAIRLNRPIVGMASTPNGGGYWLVASDGGVFDYGDAPFRGSLGDTVQPTRIVGIADGPATGGYWMVAANGAIFPFGVPFEGSAVGTSASPAVGMATTVDGKAPPVAIDDAYTAQTGVPLAVEAPGVLSNDATNGGALTASTPAQHGTVTVAADGGFVYTSVAGYVGPDSFTYTLSDAAGTSTANVALTVTGLPVAYPDSYQVAADQVTSEPAAAGVLANDTVNSATISSHTDPSYGTLTLNADGSFVYTPTSGYSGADSFTYTLTNASGPSKGTVSLSVVDPPVANPDSYPVVAGQATVPAPGVLANDTINGAILSVASGPAYGTLTLNADGSFVYTAATGYAGTDSFTYALTNAAGSVTANVSLSG